MSRLIIGWAFYALCACLAQAETLSGKVVKIADGDTLTILDRSKQQHKVRLIGIDARERKQPFGTVSRQNLAALVFGKTIAVEWYKRDRYQRILGNVLLDGEDVNLEQIKAGLAWHYKQYDKGQLPADRKLYVEAQKRASLNAIGLWSDPASVTPGDFRRNKRSLPVADEGYGNTFAGTRHRIEPTCCVCSIPFLPTRALRMLRVLQPASVCLEDHRDREKPNQGFPRLAWTGLLITYQTRVSA